MKKLTVSIALAAMSLAVHAQNMEAPIGTDLVAASEVLRFVDHPYNCQQMLGGNDGDVLPAGYNIALDASLNAIQAPVRQALARIQAICAQRVSAMSSERVSELTPRVSH